MTNCKKSQTRFNKRENIRPFGSPLSSYVRCEKQILAKDVDVLASRLIAAELFRIAEYTKNRGSLWERRPSLTVEKNRIALPGSGARFSRFPYDVLFQILGMQSS